MAGRAAAAGLRLPPFKPQGDAFGLWLVIRPFDQLIGKPSGASGLVQGARMPILQIGKKRSRPARRPAWGPGTLRFRITWAAAVQVETNAARVREGGDQQLSFAGPESDSNLSLAFGGLQAAGNQGTAQMLLQQLASARTP